MKWSPSSIPIGIRVFIFALGAMLASLPVAAVCSGKFDEGKTGHLFEISMAGNPWAFWALVVIFSLLSAGLFYVALARKFPDAWLR